MGRAVAVALLAWVILLGGARAPGTSLDRKPASPRQSLKDHLVRRGGNGRSEAAVAAGLKWLSMHQASDGHWGMHDFKDHGTCDCGGAGHKFDVAGTAFALLPFLVAGHTHKDQKQEYATQVRRGLQYLVAKQAPDGSFGRPMMAEHALATQALCLAYHRSEDPDLKGPAQRAVDFICEAQGAQGGWRYAPRSETADTEQTGWQLQALHTAQIAGLDVTPKVFARAGRWLDRCAGDDLGSTYGYVEGRASPTMTAVGLLCRQYTGWRRNYEGMNKGVEYLLQRPPSPTLKNMFYYYHATQVLYHAGGADWAKWNAKMRDLLITTQDQGTDREHQRGSWSAPGDQLTPIMGRLGQTCLALLILEIYYWPEAPLAEQPPAQLNAAELAVYWDALADDQTVNARYAMWVLVETPGRTIPFVRERLQPVTTRAAQEQVARLLKNLDDDRFTVREKASAELETLGEMIEKDLRQAMGAGSSLEAKARIERLLQKLERRKSSPDRVRARRAILTLESIGSDEAKKILAKLSAGTPEAWMTQEATATLDRLTKGTPRRYGDQ